MRKRLTLTLLICFVLVSCDETQIVDIVSDLTGGSPGMVLIPAGEVELGALVGDVPAVFVTRGSVSRRQTVYVDAFYIDTHEVTIAEYKKFVDATGYVDSSYNWYKESTPQHPIFASHDAAAAYAEWAGKRLPTRSEWEKAARGGLVGQRYPWGDAAATENHARFSETGAGHIPKPYTVPVGRYEPNSYGLYDMAGNVSEWIATDPGDTFTALCGGSWRGSEMTLRVYYSERLHVAGHYNAAGFRCVKDIPD